MSVAGGSRALILQQLAQVIQNQANANSGAQVGAGVDVFGNTGGNLAQALSNAPVIYINVRESQVGGRLEISASLGSARIFVPQQTRSSVPAKADTGNSPQASAEENVLHAVLPQGLDLASFQTHAATAAATYGRELVFSGVGHPETLSQGSSALPQSLVPQRTDNVPAGNRQAGVPGDRTAPGNPSAALRGASTPSSAGQSVVVSLPSSATVHASPAVRELLTQLQLLPPGTQSADFLPRLQEVVRLWNQASAGHADLPPDVLRVVNHFLASAVLSAALTDPKAQVFQSRSEAAPNQRFDVRDGQSNSLFSNVPTRLPQISGARIAEAVMNLLTGSPTPTPQQQPLPGDRMPQMPMPGRTDGQPLPQQSQRAPSLGPSANPNGQSGPHAKEGIANVRTDALMRLDALGRPIGREETRDPRVIVRSESQTQENDIPQVLSEGTYERDARQQETGTGDAALEALWGSLHADLNRAGFLDDRTGSIRILRTADEGRTLLRLVGGRVPEGLDLVDLLGLIDRKIGWSEKMSPVNEAFARLASYRKIGDGTKAAALLEPLQDAITILAMSGGSLTPEEDHVLRRFEGHLPVVEMFLEPEHEGWFLRLENRKSDSRSILETEMEEARALYVDHLAKQNGLRNLFNAPETPRLLN